MKKLLGVGIGLVIVLAVVIAAVAGAQDRSTKKPVVVKPAAATTTTTGKAPAHVTSPSTTTSTTTTVKPAPPSTTTTVKPKLVDPLAGVTMLGYRGREIFAVDAQGEDIRRLVLVYERRQVEGVQMMGDHHTIWYATAAAKAQPGDNQCPDIVRLDLASNKRTVIAHADGFSVSADGSRVALHDLYTEDQCKNGVRGVGTSVVRDVATGAQSTVSGAESELVISPGGHVVVSTKCSNDGDECRIHLTRADVPDHLGAPVTMQQINDPKLSFWGLTQRPDGLYALVDTHAQSCGCSGGYNRYDRDVTVRRFSWTNLGGTGTTVYTVQGPLQLWTLVPSASGLYATGIPGVGIGDPALFRLGAGSAQGLRPLNEWPNGFVTIPPFAA